MNRQERRAQRDRGTLTAVAEVQVSGCGDVAINGARWAFITDGRYLLAQPHMTLPDAMPRFSPTKGAVAASYLTSAVESHTTMRGEQLRGIVDAMVKARPAAGSIVFAVKGVAFGLEYLQLVMSFIRDEQPVSIGLRGDEVLRIDAPEVRIAIMRCIPAASTMVCELLNREQMDAMESAGGEA